MTEIRKGDRVRVTIEGTVYDVTAGSMLVDGVWVDTRKDKVEIIERAKPKFNVGDAIRGATQYEQAPDGTVVSNRLNPYEPTNMLIKRDGNWFNLLGRPERPYCERVIRRLPDSE